MRIEIEYSTAAESRLYEIVEDLWDVSARAAETFSEAHDKAISQLLQFPESGTDHPDGFRSIRISRTPYRLVYTIVGSRLTVTNVFDARSNARMR